MQALNTTPMATDVATLTEEVTHILQILVGHLSGTAPEPLNLTAMLEMLERLTNKELELLYNVTGTGSQLELIHVLNMTIMGPLVEFQEYPIQKFLLLYIPPILILLGTFGNLSSFVVLRRKPMIKVSSYLYLAVLAIIDTLILYNGLLRIWLLQLLDFDYQDAGNWICKMIVAFGYVASDLSVWLIIAVTVERYIVVCFPFQASSMCNVSRARKVIVGLFLLMLTLNAHFLWTAEIVEGPVKDTCRGGQAFRQLVEEVWPWVDTLIYSFLPFLTITVLNVLIIREVARAHSTRARLAASDSETACMPPGHTGAAPGPAARQTNTCEGTRLTALLLTVSFTFLLLTLPNNLALIVSRFWNQKYETADQLTAHEKRIAVSRRAQFRLIMTITELLMYTNHSINFFLYCATGNKFRQQLLDFLRCLRRPRHHQSQVENTMTSYSIRKTSQSWCSEMALAKRPSRRKSSCVSSEDGDKNVGSDVLFGGQATPMGVQANSFFTAGNIVLTRCGPETEVCTTKQLANVHGGNDANSCQKIPVKDNTMVNNISLNSSSLNSEKHYVPFKGSKEKQCQKTKQPRRSILHNWISCKIHQSKRKHKHALHSERSHLSSAFGLDSKDGEYFLLKPTVRWCESTTAC